MNIGHVWLVGTGGTGTHLAEPLVRLLTFHPNSPNVKFTLVDGDVFDANNSVRQLFRRQALGKYKAQYMVDNLRFINPNMEAWITYATELSFRERLSSTPWGEEDMFLVIAAVDNHATRKAFLQALIPIRNRNWLFITPGNSYDKGQVLSYGCVKGEYVGMNPFDSYPDIANPNDAIPKMGADCIEQSVSTPQLISANASAALATLLTVQSLLDENSFPSEIHFDVRRAKMVPNTMVQLT